MGPGWVVEGSAEPASASSLVALWSFDNGLADESLPLLEWLRGVARGMSWSVGMRESKAWGSGEGRGEGGTIRKNQNDKNDDRQGGAKKRE